MSENSIFNVLSKLLRKNVRKIFGCALRKEGFNLSVIWGYFIINDDSIVVINKEVKNILLTIHFEEIKYVSIKMKQISINSSNNIVSKVIIQETNEFLKFIQLEYSKYFSRHKGKNKTIEIINEDKGNQCKDNLRNLWKNLPLMHVPPEFFKLIKFNNNIFFFVPPSFKITSTNSGTIKHNNHNHIINSLIHFDFFIQQHKQIMNNFISLRKFSKSFITSYFETTYKNDYHYSIEQEHIYYKKYNFNEDECLIQGYYLQFTIDNPIKKEYLCYIIRKLYEPPFLETFSDFVFIFHFEYQKEITQQFQLDQKTKNEIELIVDSLYEENIPNYNEYTSLIELNIIYLNYNYHILKYIKDNNIIDFNTINIFIQEGVQFVLRILSDFIYEIDKMIGNNKKDVLLNDLKDLLRDIQNYYNLQNQKIESVENIVNNCKQKIKVNNKEILNNKINEFFLFCLDGGVCGSNFNLNKILYIKQMYSKYNNIKSLYTKIIHKLLMNPLH